VKIPEILQIETPHARGALASVLNVLSETGLGKSINDVLCFPGLFDAPLHSRAVEAVVLRTGS